MTAIKFPYVQFAARGNGMMCAYPVRDDLALLTILHIMLFAAIGIHTTDR